MGVILSHMPVKSESARFGIQNQAFMCYCCGGLRVDIIGISDALVNAALDFAKFLAV